MRSKSNDVMSGLSTTTMVNRFMHPLLLYPFLNASNGLETLIVLGDGGHHGMGYVTPTSAVQLVSKLCKLFDLMTSR